MALGCLQLHAFFFIITIDLKLQIVQRQEMQSTDSQERNKLVFNVKCLLTKSVKN